MFDFKKKLLTRLPVLLVQIKARNNSKTEEQNQINNN